METITSLLVQVGLGLGQFYFPNKSQKNLKSSIQHIEIQLWEMLTTTILF